MHFDVLNALSIFLVAPFLLIPLIFVYYQRHKAVWKRKKRLGKKNLGFCPSSFALGMAFQFVPVFYRPSEAFVLEARLQEDVEEKDQGDPETPAKHLQRQLRRIRRGEQIETLVLRL